jgi:hypothetical protein
MKNEMYYSGSKQKVLSHYSHIPNSYRDIKELVGDKGDSPYNLFGWWERDKKLVKAKAKAKAKLGIRIWTRILIPKLTPSL